MQALSGPVLTAVGERYYKVTAEALRVCGELVKAIRPNLDTVRVNCLTHGVQTFLHRRQFVQWMASCEVSVNWMCFETLCLGKHMVGKSSEGVSRDCWLLLKSWIGSSPYTCHTWVVLWEFLVVECNICSVRTLNPLLINLQPPVFNYIPFVHPIYNAIFKRLTAQDQDQVCFFLIPA
jgi:hypothetical protein